MGETLVDKLQAVENHLRFLGKHEEANAICDFRHAVSRADIVSTSEIQGVVVEPYDDI